MTIIGPDGEPFHTYLEIIDQRDAERRRANEAERQRAEAERQRAEAERQRAEAERQKTEAERLALAEREKAERLAAKLRELGIESE